MSVGRPFVYPAEQARARAKSIKLAWLSVVLLLLASLGLLLTLGQSEAMKTAWVSDLLTILPPVSLLVASRYELRPPSVRFPYGYHRAIAVVFLVTAASLTLFGATLFLDAAMKLLKAERPPIGAFTMLGHRYDVWAGWPMIAALAFSAVAGLTIGLLKQPVSRVLQDKELDAEATMNRDEWMSEGAAIVGLLLVAFGQWWGDAVAAALISLGVIRDGWSNLRHVIADLMDETPNPLGSSLGKPDPLPGRLRDTAESLPWVERAMVRLREHGRLLTGEVFVVPNGETAQVADLAALATTLEAVDWRLRDLSVVPVDHLEPHPPART